MKKLSIIALAGALLLSSSCMDLKGLYDKMNDFETRLVKVESELSTTTQTANSVNTIVSQLKDNVFVSSVEETPDKDGYVISFTD